MFKVDGTKESLEVAQAVGLVSTGPAVLRARLPRQEDGHKPRRFFRENQSIFSGPTTTKY